MKFLKLIYMDMARKSEKKRMLGTDGWTTTDYNDACRMGYIVIEMNKNATKPGYVDLIEEYLLYDVVISQRIT